MIKIKLCLLLIIIIALTGCNGEERNIVPDSSIQNKEDNEIKEPETKEETEHIEQEPVKDGFKRGKVYPTTMYDLTLDYVSDPNLYNEEAEKYKIVVDVFNNWYQMDVHNFLEHLENEEGLIGRMNGFTLNIVSKDFIMDETIKSVIDDKTPELDWDPFFGFFDNSLTVTSGTTKKGLPYIQYVPDQIKEGEKAEYWHFVRASDEIVIEFHTILDWDDRDEMDYILNSIFLTERDS
ncbi:hypothetical protein HZF24_17525 [Sedimentibacter hydroxybenzoicus DSM 7310]|uniref:Lipoprotein n=1 Tax=Sedimentibacter hydroxybenzoicus DSM 7310 TaxID=1123245 RepID=A0A974GY74_SEDHY|nr:hypothetical protein [Sedimentibacter hydroxybenzoicus]NYB75951.1 hypothetical protein [Sedimentibacter hydroxybenzoicus DSM 7310]